MMQKIDFNFAMVFIWGAIRPGRLNVKKLVASSSNSLTFFTPP